MAEPASRGDREFPILSPPPRTVPLALRVRLLASAPALFGSLFFGLGCLIGLPLFLASDPLGTWRLARRLQPARGVLETVEATGVVENERTVYRYAYTFRLPDGTRTQGQCFGTIPLGGPPGKNQLVSIPVIVQYDPMHPETSRIQGTHTGRLDPGVGIVLIFPLIGVVITAIAVSGARRRIDLLANGVAVRATITACKVTEGLQESQTSPRMIPFDEFRQRWWGKEIVLESLKLPSQEDTIAVEANRPPIPPGLQMARGCASAWTLGVAVMIGFGVIFIGGLLAAVVIWNVPFRFGNQPASKSTAVLFCLVFLVAWVGMGLLMLRVSGRMKHVLAGEIPPTESIDEAEVECAFEFTLPDGRTQTARDTVPMIEPMLDRPDWPALYDPDRPSRAFLVGGLFPPPTITEFGDWEASWNRATLRNLAIMLACWFGSPLAGVAIWRLFVA